MARPISWPAGTVRARGDYLHMETSKRIGEPDLPVEFFNNELMAVDPDSDSSLFDFCSKWGFPYSPTRNSHPSQCKWLKRRTFQYAQRAVSLTDEANDSYYQLYESYGHSTAQWDENGYNSAIISIWEVSFTIELFQNAVRELREYVKGERGRFIYSEMVDLASCNPMQADWELANTDRAGAARRLKQIPLNMCGFLTPAICNQIIGTMADSTPWKLCANEKCGKPFKHRHGLKRTAHRDSAYCCQRCSDNQRKRNQRAAAKQRVDYGG